MEDQRLERMLFVDYCQLFRVSLLQAIKYVNEQVRKNLQYLMVVFFDGHFKVETNKLAHVTMRVRVFSTKDWTDLVHTLQASDSTSHLLVYLRALCKSSFLVKVLQRKTVGSAL
ncbi:hypothetical protein PsorP6_000117 [Peronosclerospora sorghi]|uniref:Uncharacterized protein n=1 Tax=Peronosclerospora sorghi TaxID=230839 RepID=A0ACC0WSB6_9STRA|nr:hypothetical protein PsorP6_000117 [Peronosclerospora sorghi]